MDTNTPGTRRIRQLSIAAASLAWLALLASGGLSAAPLPRGQDVGDAGGTAEKKPGVTEELSEDERFVRENLQEYLRPNTLEFRDDGRVHLSFDFERKDPEHSRIFTPPVQTKVNTTFRWTVRREEYYSSYYTSRRQWYRGGLRVSDKGRAVLNCWFEDNVEAEVLYFSHTNFRRGDTAALAFANKSGGGLGSNFGSQSRIYRKVTPTKKVSGSPQSMALDSAAKIGLVVRDGTFEARRDGRKVSSLEYSKKQYSSGKIGFIWGPRIMGTITRLDITGRIDYEMTAKEMRKRMGRGRTKRR